MHDEACCALLNLLGFASAFWGQISAYFQPRLTPASTAARPGKKRCRQSRFHVEFLQAHPKLAHRPSLVLPCLTACLPSPFFTRPSSIGARGREGRRGRKDEEARRRKERNRRSHFPPFLPRTALRAVKRRWKTGQGARAATNERSPAGEKRVRKPPNEGGNAREGGRGEKGAAGSTAAAAANAK